MDLHAEPVIYRNAAFRIENVYGIAGARGIVIAGYCDRIQHQVCECHSLITTIIVERYCFQIICSKGITVFCFGLDRFRTLIGDLDTGQFHLGIDHVRRVVRMAELLVLGHRIGKGDFCFFFQ